MVINKNPFVTSGYISPEFFCDREEESERLIQEISGNNLALISTRRMGKTGLIQHCFQQMRSCMITTRSSWIFMLPSHYGILFFL